ncbi:MAG TPA: hypothetical protein VMT89_16375 [Candidatus Acidoferrales bacterium]|nr:hypothetical protein [Candidatus Acidoferrales bacterium]
MGLTLPVLILLWCLQPTVASARRVEDSDVDPIDEAWTRIVRSVDPCGESKVVLALLRDFKRCPNATYKISTDTTATRNVFDRQHDTSLRVITWNPQLRSELEVGCDGDPTRTVQRDPVASLLHEIAHAVQDCHGLNPGEHEADAVRIENIYRRAVRLCQRSRYGDEILPGSVLKFGGLRGQRCWSPHSASLQRQASLAAPDSQQKHGAVARQASGDRPNSHEE